MAGRIPSRGSEQFVVRMPDGMRDRLKAEADANGRSMNAEIIARLEDSFIEEPAGESLRRLLYPLMEEMIEAYQRGEKPKVTFRRKPKADPPTD